MTSSETPGTVSRLVVASITAVAALLIVTGFLSGLAGDGLSAQESDLRNFVKDVNRVCDEEQSFAGDVIDIGDYRINRSQKDESQVMLVNANEEVEATRGANCPIKNKFRISNNYRVEPKENSDSVTITENYDNSQTGGLDE